MNGLPTEVRYQIYMWPMLFDLIYLGLFMKRPMTGTLNDIYVGLRTQKALKTVSAYSMSWPPSDYNDLETIMSGITTAALTSQSSLIYT